VTGANLARLFAWTIALGLVALPVVGVLNGWFASERWPITQLSVRAEFNHVSAEQIRAAAQPLLGQGFFAMRLDQVRDAVARLPWVERAEARKRWPDTIDLVVYEQQPYARWSNDRLVNRQGELFSVAGSAGLQGLPQLSGPDERRRDVLLFYADCLREFSGSGLVIDAVGVSSRGGWRIGLASGAVIEIGRDEPRKRLERFLDIWPRLAGQRTDPLAYIDLRYENGFALRWAEKSADPGHGIPDSEGAPPGTPAEPSPDSSPAVSVPAPSTHAAALAYVPAGLQARDRVFPTSRIPTLESRPL
jgi:cell division protein FtsQ